MGEPSEEPFAELIACPPLDWAVAILSAEFFPTTDYALICPGPTS